MQMLQNLFAGPTHPLAKEVLRMGAGGASQAVPCPMVSSGRPGRWGAGQVWALHSWELGLSLSQGFRARPRRRTAVVQAARSVKRAPRQNRRLPRGWNGRQRQCQRDLQTSQGPDCEM